MENFICCQKFSKRKNINSPFQQLVSFDYYDGTTAGITKCSICNREYKYDMVAWDNIQEQRVFSLARLPTDSFSMVVKLFEKYDSPSLPFWFPKWNFPTESIKDEVESSLALILKKAKTVSIIILTQNLTQILIIAKTITTNDFQVMQKKKEFEEWNKFLFNS